MTADGRLLRVDLLVREAWGTLVIDYKSGQPAPEHARQVRSYVENLAAEPGSGVTLGLLVYLDLQRFQLVTAETLSELVPECGSLLPSGGAGAPPTSPEGRP